MRSAELYAAGAANYTARGARPPKQRAQTC